MLRQQVIEAMVKPMIIENKGLPIPWKPLKKPLADGRLALVTTAGVHLADQNPFDVNAKEGNSITDCFFLILRWTLTVPVILIMIIRKQTKISTVSFQSLGYRNWSNKSFSALWRLIILLSWVLSLSPSLKR